VSVILDVYRKAKRRNPDRLVLFESGRMLSFVDADALEVSRLLGEPHGFSTDCDCEIVDIAKPRLNEIASRLELLGRKLVAFRRDARPPRKWTPFSLETPPDVSNIEFASEVAFEDAIKEMENGKMETCWAWFAFPRMTGSWDMSADRRRGLKTLRESRVVLKRKKLGANLRRIADSLLAHAGTSVEAIFGIEGALHVRASATLFALTAKEKADRERYAAILDTFFGGEKDKPTVDAVVAELESPRDDTPRDLMLTDGPERVAVRTAR
jgi:uncharacterized protein (DUF1810 family)